MRLQLLDRCLIRVIFPKVSCFWGLGFSQGFGLVRFTSGTPDDVHRPDGAHTPEELSQRGAVAAGGFESSHESFELDWSP